MITSNDFISNNSRIDNMEGIIIKCGVCEKEFIHVFSDKEIEEFTAPLSGSKKFFRGVMPTVICKNCGQETSVDMDLMERIHQLIEKE